MTRLIRNSRGATLVEAAIMTPLLLLLTFAIVDFARAVLRLSGARERREPGDALRRDRQHRAPGMTREALDQEPRCARRRRR